MRNRADMGSGRILATDEGQVFGFPAHEIVAEDGNTEAWLGGVDPPGDSAGIVSIKDESLRVLFEQCGKTGLDVVR